MPFSFCGVLQLLVAETIEVETLFSKYSYKSCDSGSLHDLLVHSQKIPPAAIKFEK